jgi:hypothetical protein
MRSLHQCLLDTAIPRLRAIARFWGVDLASERRPEAAAQLAEAMAHPEVIASARAALPDDPRRALEALLAEGGRMPQRIFARRWGEIRAMGPGRMERERPWREPASPAEALWYTGFISRAFEQGDEGTYEVTFVPPELLAHLPVAGATPPTIALDPAPEPAAVRPAADAFLDDACTLVSYLQNERLRPAADGTWPARHEANLKRRLREPDLARLDLLRHVVERLGWLRRTDSDHLRPDPAPVTSWLQSSPDEQRRALAEAWRDDATWNDLFHVPALEPVETGAWRNDPLLARQAILRHLRACAPGTWYALDGFVAAVKQAEPDFQRPDGDYTSWYIRDAVTGAYLSGFESWDAVEGALIRSMIAGPLAWLGVADVGAARIGDPPLAFRIAPAGAVFLGLAKPLPAQPGASLALRPDFTVLAPAARRYERFQLSRVAEWVRTGDSFVYRLTPASLDRARQQGIPVARVLEFLGRATGAPVPRAVEAALTRWEARGAEARLERVVLLRLSSEDLMAQITSSPATRRLIQEQVGPAVALVREADRPRLVAALGKMGLLPDVSGIDEGDE